jgi:hypothetical protein
MLGHRRGEAASSWIPTRALVALVMLSTLLVPWWVTAEDGVCGDATVMTRYLVSMDPSKMPPAVGGKPCVVISKANTPAQRALVQATAPHYLKVVGGLAVEMTQGEKDVVNAAEAAAQAVVQAHVDETTANTLCNTATESDITNRVNTIHDNIGTDIAAVTNIATAKTALTSLNDAYAAAFKQLGRCLVARRFVR